MSKMIYIMCRIWC